MKKRTLVGKKSAQSEKKSESGSTFRLLADGPLAEPLRAAGMVLTVLPETGWVAVRTADAVRRKPDQETIVSTEPSFEQMRIALMDSFGEEGMKRVIRAGDDDADTAVFAARLGELQESEPVRPEGFETCLRVPDALVEQYLQALPRTWVSRLNVTSLRAQRQEWGYCRRTRNGSEILVGMDGIPEGMERNRSVLNALAHEFGHGADMLAMDGMDPDERVRFAYLFLQRMRSPDGPRFLRVRSVRETDARRERIARFLEYVAEIVRVVFQPHAVSQTGASTEESAAILLASGYGATLEEARANVRLARSYAEATDPRFDFERSQRSLDALDAQLRAEHCSREMIFAIDRVRDPELRAFLRGFSEGHPPAQATHPILDEMRYHAADRLWETAYEAWSFVFDAMRRVHTQDRAREPRGWTRAAETLHALVADAEAARRTAEASDADPSHAAAFRRAVLRQALAGCSYAHASVR